MQTERNGEQAYVKYNGIIFVFDFNVHSICSIYVNTFCTFDIALRILHTQTQTDTHTRTYEFNAKLR